MCFQVIAQTVQLLTVTFHMNQ